MRVAILSGILFLSGISALVFETLWLRLSGLAFGNSVWSAALILSSFMAGLALGNALASALKIQRIPPLKLYALLEIGIALFGCTIVFGIPLLGEWLRPIFQMLWGHEALMNVLRFALSFLILLVPTTAMGLTLPILLNDAALKRHEFGRAIGFLYGANTLGAFAGALIGEGVLIKAFGLFGTSATAGLLNGAAAAIAFFVAKTDGASQSEAAADGGGPPPGRLIPQTGAPARGRAGSSIASRFAIACRPPWRWLAVSFGTGAILLCLEVVWFRFLRLYIASSSTAFAIMLAVVLAGIGLGGIVAGAVHRRIGKIPGAVTILLLLAAITTLLCYTLFPMPALGKGEEFFYYEDWPTIAWLSLILMFPTSFVSGLLFPMIAARVQENVGDRTNSAGLTTLFNTAGAAIGPLIASFVLLPHLGFETSLILCVGGYALLVFAATQRLTPAVAGAMGFSFLLLAVILGFTPWQRGEAHLANSRSPYHERDFRLVKTVEGTSDTFQLMERDFLGEPYYHRLLTNAYSMASTNPRNQRYIRLFAYLPQVLRPQSEDALLICFGLGATADALTRNASLKHVDVVDLSREVVSLAELHADPARGNPLRDPRVQTFIQDGRFFLQATPRNYDIITGEPPPPKVAGSVNLYTEQFFSLIHDRLKDGGVTSFWLPIYQMKPQETKAILRGFRNVFKNASLWAGPDHEWIMIGIKGEGQKLDEDAVRRVWSDGLTGADLTRIGLEVPEQLPALFLMDASEMDRITKDVAPLTDYHPKRLTDDAARFEETFDFAWPYMEGAPAFGRFRSSSLTEQIWPDKLKRIEPFFLVRESRYLSETTPANRLAELDLFLRRSKLRVPVLELLGSDEFRVAILERVAAKTQPPREAVPDLIAAALARRDIAAAVKFLEGEKAGGFIDPRSTLLLIYLYCLNDEVAKAEALAAAESGTIPKSTQRDWLWKNMQAEFGFRPPN